MNAESEANAETTGTAREGNESRLRELIAAAPFGAHLYTLDPEGRLVFAGANRAADVILRLDHHRLIGRTIEEAFPGLKQTAIPEAYRRVAREGTAYEQEQVNYDEEGIQGAFEIRAFQIGPNRMVVFFRDITERKRAEENLASERLLLRVLVDHLPVSIYVKDLSGRKTLANALDLRYLGVKTEAEALGKTDFDFYSPELAAQFQADDQRVLHSGQPVLDREEQVVDAQGQSHWLLTSKVPLRDSTGRVIGLMGIGRDITERRLARKALELSEARLQSIFRAAPVGIGVVVNRVIQQVNRQICVMTGYTAQELAGQSARLLYPSQEEFEWVGREKYRQIAELGTGVIETRWRRKDGTLLDVLMSSTPIVAGDLNGGVTFTVLDITERKRAAEERQKLEAQVQHAQKLESLGVLAGGIAHDFNNLLTTILGNAELALMDLSPLSPARPSLQEIVQASRCAAELCKQMLAYSGKGRFVIQSVDLGEVVTEMTQMLEVSISKKAMLKKNLAPNLPAVEADATQLRQVIMNLVINASEAIGDQPGLIVLTTGQMECDHAYLASTYLDQLLPEGPYVFLEVADTGCGMDKATLARIFDPFFTTKFTGRGLGLAAALGIVRGHRGAIKVYSEPGQGTTFKVLLPATARPADSLDVRRGSPAAWRGQGTVLLVDDEAGIRETARRMLERLGFQVLIAEDGRRALEVFKAHAEPIACVLLDLTMPRMDGEETFRELRRLQPSVRVLLSSGYNEQAVVQRFAGKGLAGFVQKPYTMENLATALQGMFAALDPPGGPS